jgi:peptidyl-dipeptidase A
MTPKHPGRRHTLRVMSTLALASLSLVTACTAPPSVEEARTFLEEADARLLALSHREGRTAWLQATYINPDTDALAAEARQAMMAATVELAKDATRFDRLDLPPELARQMKLLKLALTLPGPAGAEAQAELARLAFEARASTARGSTTADPSTTSRRSWRRAATTTSFSTSGRAGARSRPR